MGDSGRKDHPIVTISALLLGYALGWISYNGPRVFNSYNLDLPAGGSMFITWGVAIVLSYGIALIFRDPLGLTFYGKFGEGPGAVLMWAFIAAILIELSVSAFPRHWPTIGNHGVPIGSPLDIYLHEDRCIDNPPAERLDFCTEDLCAAARIGDEAFATSHCNGEPWCSGSMQAVYNVAMSSCWGTCGCKVEDDMFNPIAQTGPASEDFACVGTGTCRELRGSCLNWNFAKYRWAVELHVATGIFIFFLFPLQFVKTIRMWNDKLIHRWSGRVLALLSIPNQFSALWLCIAGLSGPTACHDYIILWRAILIPVSCMNLGFIAAAIYFVRNGDVPKHGNYMMRASATWFTIPAFRIISPLVTSIFGARWRFPVGAFLSFGLPFLAVETYVRTSGRFVQPSHATAEDAEAELTKEGLTS